MLRSASLLKRKQPLFDDDFHLPRLTKVDRSCWSARRSSGSAGDRGYCPGPASRAVHGQPRRRWCSSPEWRSVRDVPAPRGAAARTDIVGHVVELPVGFLAADLPSPAVTGALSRRPCRPRPRLHPGALPSICMRSATISWSVAPLPSSVLPLRVRSSLDVDLQPFFSIRRDLREAVGEPAATRSLPASPPLALSFHCSVVAIEMLRGSRRLPGVPGFRSRPRFQRVSLVTDARSLLR